MKKLVILLLWVGTMSAQSISVGANIPAMSAGEYGVTWRPGFSVEAAGITANVYSDGIFNFGYQVYFKSGSFCSEERGQSLGLYLWRDNLEISWGTNRDWGRMMAYINFSEQDEIPLPVVISGGMKIQFNIFSF